MIDFFKKWKILIVASVAIVMIVFWGLSSALGNNTKEQVLDSFSIAIKGNDIKEFATVVRVDGKKVNGDKLFPFLEYVKDEVSKDEKYLEKNNGLFTMECEDKIIGENYFININSIGGRIGSNVKDVEIRLNDKVISKDGVVENIIPGIYKLSYKYKTEYGDVTHEEVVTLIKNIDVVLDIPITNISIYSEFKDAKVYINDKYIGKNVEEVQDYGPIPTEKQITIHIEKEFPWGVISSDKITLGNEKLIKIDINMINKQLKNDFEKCIDEFYDSVFKALNLKDKNLIIAESDDVKTKIYEEMEKKTFIIKNNYEISNLQVKIENSEVLLNDNTYNANIVSNIKYTVSKKFIFDNRTEYDQDFLIGLKYIDGKWIVGSIQSFNIQE